MSIPVFGTNVQNLRKIRCQRLVVLPNFAWFLYFLLNILIFCPRLFKATNFNLSLSPPNINNILTYLSISLHFFNQFMLKKRKNVKKLKCKKTSSKTVSSLTVFLSTILHVWFRLKNCNRKIIFVFATKIEERTNSIRNCYFSR